MKFGKEVEGHFLGARTIFCDALEVPSFRENFDELMQKYKVEHLYVCDHNGLLTQTDYENLNYSIKVTVEVYKVPPVVRPLNVSFMVAVPIDPRSLGFFDLHGRDQIKFTGNLFVATALYDSFYLTEPSDFENDIEVSL